MKKLKIGVIGLGNIGRVHMENLAKLEQVEIAGLCDVFRENADKWASVYQTKAYYAYRDMLDHPGLEAVVIAVPHFEHVAVALEAFDRGIHVLCEKPVSVHVNDATKINAAYEAAKQKYPNLVFGMMFQERTWPIYRSIADIVRSGELGKLMRVTWIITSLFRTQAYYDSGGWRATWKGEGGGILVNQCPHNIDFYQWLFGVPSRISGHANLGKYHDIEVEDEVFGYFEHDNGMVGHFMATTGESPGTNRLEIVGEHGKLVAEHNKLSYERNKVSTLQFLKESADGFANVETELTEIALDPPPPFTDGHKTVAEAFIRKIMTGEGELVAEGIEGIGSVQISNGILLSSMTGRIVEVPFDGGEYDSLLQQLINNSEHQAQV